MRKPERFSRASTSTSIPNGSKGSSGTETDASRRCRTYSHAPGRDSVTAADSSKPNPVTNENRRPTLPSRFSFHFFDFVGLAHSVRQPLSARGPKARSHGTRDASRPSLLAKTWIKNPARSRCSFAVRLLALLPAPRRDRHMPPQPIPSLAHCVGSAHRVGWKSVRDRPHDGVRSHRQPLSTGPVRGTVVSHFGSSPIGGRQIPADSHDSPSHELPSSVTRPPTASPVTGSRATPAASTPCTRPLPARTHRTGCPFPRETPRETH